MQSPLLSQFDKEIAGIATLGNPRDALNIAKRHACHALVKASEIVLKSFGNQEEAIDLLDAAVRLNTRDEQVYERLANLHSQLSLYQKALAYAEAGLKIKETPMLLYHKAVALRVLNKLDDSLSTLRRLVEIDPGNADAHVELSDVLLLLGQFPEGLKEAEWKFQAYASGRQLVARFKKPFWDGKADLKGKRILVFHDQGRGDSINYHRYLSCLKNLGAYVILEAIKDLYRLYEGCPDADEVIEKRESFTKVVPRPGEKTKFVTPNQVELPEHDYVIANGSLPLFFDPNLEDVANLRYLWPKEEAGEKLQEAFRLIDEHKDKFKVGIIWAGNPWHLNDRYRSCHLKHFQPLAMPGVQLFSLQMGNMKRSWPQGDKALWDGYDGEVNIVDLTEGSSVPYVDLAPFLGDFNDTALLLRKLDLLVCVDTGTAHLAGALARPVWLLLPQACEWRWQRDWYASLRKYRQDKHGDWAGLLEKVAGDLAIRKEG